MLVRRTSGVSPQAIKTTRLLLCQCEWFRPKHDMTDGLLMLVDHMWPKATLLIGLS